MTKPTREPPLTAAADRRAGELKPQHANGFIPWLADWPQYKQACFLSWDDRCDMLIGPCCCGAWHQVDEFEVCGDVLLRYGEVVPSRIMEPSDG